MKYKAIIFDMDGTIIDTEHIWNKATRELITKRGVTITPEIEQELSRKLAGNAMAESCRIIKEMLNLQDELHHLIAEKSAHANSMYQEGVCFIDGFLDFHKKVTQEHQLQVGLATNADDQTLNITNKALNLSQLFGKHLYNISHVSHPKPNPEIYLHAAQQLGLKPEQCIAIEDSPHGAQAARDAGMFCIGINTAKKPERLNMCDIIIDRYDEIDLKELLGIK
jgi:HAD superfamily hydrolase (TIGR01509 family)